MKDGGRARRVAAQIQRALAELLPRTVKDPRVGSVTITAVNLAPDMTEARVFFLPFGGKHAPDETLRGLNCNNNPYNLDSSANWLAWTRSVDQTNFQNFAQAMIAFRKAHPSLRPAAFYSSVDNNGNVMEQLRWFKPDGTVADGTYLNDASQHAIAWQHMQLRVVRPGVAFTGPIELPQLLAGGDVVTGHVVLIHDEDLPLASDRGELRRRVADLRAAALPNFLARRAVVCDERNEIADLRRIGSGWCQSQ